MCGVVLVSTEPSGSLEPGNDPHPHFSFLLALQWLLHLILESQQYLQRWVSKSLLPVGKDRGGREEGKEWGWSGLGAASLSCLPTCLVTLTERQTDTHTPCMQGKETGGEWRRSERRQLQEAEPALGAGIVRRTRQTPRHALEHNRLPGMPSTASTQGNINTASCSKATIMIKTDPVLGKQVVVPFLMGHLGLGKVGMASGLSGLGCSSSPYNGAERQGETNRERKREHGSDGVSEICIERQKRSPSPHPPWRDADYLPGLSQQGGPGIQRGGSSCLTKEKSQRRPHCGTLGDLAASDTPASVAVDTAGLV